jgi:hypothetical protein
LELPFVLRVGVIVPDTDPDLMSSRRDCLSSDDTELPSLTWSDADNLYLKQGLLRKAHLLVRTGI